MRNYFYGWYFKCQSETQTLSISLRFTGQDKRNLVPFRSLRRIMRGTLIILPRHSTGQERIFGSERVGLERGEFFWQYIRQSWI